MDSLIQITKNTINGVEINSVNARELYNNLGLAKGQYSRWIQNNLIDQFLYNDDYIGVRQVVEGNEVVSHIVTLDTAKHLCMMAKTQNAMKFRKYFIDFEKQENNSFIAVSELGIKAKGSEDKFYPDITLFVNGIPLVVVEAKSPKVKKR